MEIEGEAKGSGIVIRLRFFENRYLRSGRREAEEGKRIYHREAIREGDSRIGRQGVGKRFKREGFVNLEFNF